MSEGQIQPDGHTVIFNHPVLDGFAADVQHTVKSGKPVSRDPGMVGAGVVVLPTGQPRVVLQLRHADETSMSVSLKAGELATLLECLMDAARRAEQIAEASLKAARQ